MRHSLVVVMLFLQGSAALASEDVLAAVAKLGDAYRDADVVTLSGMVTDDYIHTNSSSPPIDRDAWLGWVASRRAALDDGTLRVVEYEMTDLRVVRHGDAAIVTGLNRTVAEEKGKTRASKVRFTMLWVKTDAGWKRAAFQDCRE